MIRIDVTTSATDEVVESARRILADSVEESLRDDRFSAKWESEIRQPESRFGAAIARVEGRPVGIVTMTQFRDRVMLESLLASGSGIGGVGEAVLLDQLLEAVLDPETGLVETSDRAVELWAKPATSAYDDAVERFGFTPHRTLLQLRCDLPVDAGTIKTPTTEAPTTLPTRPFVPGQDEEALLSVNNRAFASHPDQGQMRMDELQATMASPWFDPEGVRLFEKDGRLAGFCWTKVHTDPVPLGEIYVIGVDPDFHGQGLGVPMTNSGLQWLWEQGQTTGMLYVEGDNAPALATYARLGFRTVRTDRAWRLPTESAVTS